MQLAVKLKGELKQPRKGPDASLVFHLSAHWEGKFSVTRFHLFSYFCWVEKKLLL